MICNKCGKNNPAEAEKCSGCGEPMPSASSCGGFSDILTYSADVKAEVPASSAPAQEEGRQVMEIKENSETSKKAMLLSLIAIGISVITLICVIVCLVKISAIPDDMQTESADSNIEDNGDTDQDEESQQNAERSIESKGLPAIDSDSNVKIEILDNDGNSVETEILDKDGKPVEKVNKTTYKDGFTIAFTAGNNQFPMTVKYGTKTQKGKLVLNKDGVPEWKYDVVKKKGTATIPNAGLMAGADVDIEYNGKMVCSGKIAAGGKTEIPIEIEIESNVDSIDVDVSVDGKKQNIEVKVNLTEVE